MTSATPWIGIFAAGLLVGCGQPSAAADARMPAAKESKRIAMDTLKQCEPRSARLNLVDEALLTRTAITPETIDGHAPPVTIGAGDPRLAKLGAVLHGLTLESPKLPQFEMRLLMKVECADGSTLVIAGSRTEEDGRIELSVDGKPASTRQPLRRELETLVR